MIYFIYLIIIMVNNSISDDSKYHHVQQMVLPEYGSGETRDIWNFTDFFDLDYWNPIGSWIGFHPNDKIDKELEEFKNCNPTCNPACNPAFPYLPNPMYNANFTLNKEFGFLEGILKTIYIYRELLFFAYGNVNSIDLLSILIIGGIYIIIYILCLYFYEPRQNNVIRQQQCN